MSPRANTCLCVIVLTLTVACDAAPPAAQSEKSPPPEATVTVKATALLSTAAPPMLNIMQGLTCPPYVQEELREPARILPVDGILHTQLIVAMKERCVPVFDTAAKRWNLERLALRTYGFPKDHSDAITGEEVQASLEDANMVWSAPGPTMVLSKATAPGRNDGTRFKTTLFNALAPQADPHACNELKKDLDPPYTPDTAPNCFHGDNSTNFHMHGSHVSPQPHQDFVGLELLPFGSMPPEHATHSSRGVTAIGEYPIDVDPIRYTQAEGTHWYHAHKHGATALQVLNGLVGAFEIRGEFDTQLESFFASQDQGGLRDRLLVVQQLQETLPAMESKSAGSPSPLINGQANPILTMRPGEIQRWRFVGATMQASAKLDIGFSQDDKNAPEVRQIAMDGVQFAPQNYACQPILRGPDCQAGTADDSFKELNDFALDPGVRIDLLVKAPATEGRHMMTFEMTAGLDKKVLQMVSERLAAQAVADGSSDEPPLLTVEVKGAPVNNAVFPSEAEFPALPPFLADIQAPFKNHTVNYQMSNQFNLKEVHFSINDTQYNPACVNATLTLDVAEQWTLTNNSDIAHPFHIHTNPFQLVSALTWVKQSSDQGETTYLPTPVSYQAPYIWRDTVAIPTWGKTADKKGEAVIRYLAREFTGEFVNHCHILGHEDRGMMHGVQSVCANGEYGRPTDDLGLECREGNYLPAAPACQ